MINDCPHFEFSEPKENEIRRRIAIVFWAERSAFLGERVSVNYSPHFTSLIASLFKLIVKDIWELDPSSKDVMHNRDVETFRASSADNCVTFPRFSIRPKKPPNPLSAMTTQRGRTMTRREQHRTAQNRTEQNRTQLS